MISVSERAIASLMRTGLLVSPKPGNSITLAPMRANTRMKAAARAGSSEMSIRMIQPHCASPADDSRRDPHHVALQCVGHKWQRQQQRHENRQDLRHEDQRLFLDLRQRLDQ